MTSALVDTGCARSSCSVNFAKRIKAKILPLESGDVRQLIAANCQPIHVIGRVDLDINVRGLVMPFTFLVLDRLSHNLLLGADFLRYHSAQVDFTTNTISFQDDLVALNFHKRCKAETVLKSAQTVTVPPHTEALIGTLIPQKYVNNVCLVGPLVNHRNMDLCVARIVIVPNTNIACCRVFNTSPTKSQVIKIGARIACISPAQVLTNDAAKTTNQSNINSIRTPPPLKEMEEAIQKLGIQTDRSHLTDSEYHQLCVLLYTNIDVFSTGPYDLGRTTLTCHRIDTGNATPIRLRPYRQPLQYRKEIERQTAELLKA